MPAVETPPSTPRHRRPVKRSVWVLGIVVVAAIAVSQALIVAGFVIVFTNQSSDAQTARALFACGFGIISLLGAAWAITGVVALIHARGPLSTGRPYRRADAVVTILQGLSWRLVGGLVAIDASVSPWLIVVPSFCLALPYPALALWKRRARGRASPAR